MFRFFFFLWGRDDGYLVSMLDSILMSWRLGNNGRAVTIEVNSTREIYGHRMARQQRIIERSKEEKATEGEGRESERSLMGVGGGAEKRRTEPRGREKNRKGGLYTLVSVNSCSWEDSQPDQTDIVHKRRASERKRTRSGVRQRRTSE